MATTYTQPHRRRLIGWYAVYWTRAFDWFKSYRGGGDSGKREMPADQVVAGKVSPADEASLEEDTSRTVPSEAKRLQDAVEDTHRILAQARSVFPLMIFPDMITVDRQKLTIVYKKFFKSHQTVGVPLENVKNIQADIGPFFGSLTITSDQFINNTQTITCLSRRDARNIQKLVQGITAALSEGIDLSKISTKELKELLSKLGEGHIAVLEG